MQHRRQGSQAAGPARDHQQPAAVAKQRGETAEDMCGAEVVHRDVMVDYGNRVVVGFYARVVVG